MFKLNLKIALRSIWRNKGITAINVGGLAIALATFILVTLFFNYETSFDKDNPNYDNIYIVGRDYPEFKTNYTAPPLAKAIKDNFPEVIAAGKIRSGVHESLVSYKNNKTYIRKDALIDYELAKMLNIQPQNGLQKPNGGEKLVYMSNEVMATLFPNKKDSKPELVIIGSKALADTLVVSGSVLNDKHSFINFDNLVIHNNIGGNEDYGSNNYHTYIQVKAGTDINFLTQKIDKLYKAELVKGDSKPNWDRINSIKIFLDPLKNLHLKPVAGNDSNYKILIALSVLGFSILMIACINFTNLSIAQAANRAKEVGVKKVIGAYRFQLTFQFLIEILMQCFVATVLGLILAELILPKFNNLFTVDVSIWQTNNLLAWQLPLILCFITIIAGVYPAMVLSRFKPVAVLKGNFQTSRQSYILRNSLLILQFVVAVIFINGLFIINSQLKYMRIQDKGFNAEQVVYIKSQFYYDSPKSFRATRDRIMKIPGIKSVTTAGSIPDGSKLGSNSYIVNGKEETISYLDVDFDYFETLDIKLKVGRFFDEKFKSDTANSAILNESAIVKYGLTNPIGKTIRGCNVNYSIVGVVKDFKAQGFETKVEPTIYAMKNPCGNWKLDILMKIEERKMAIVLATLKSQWNDINQFEIEDFRYEFLDELYGKLFKKQAQLQSVFFAAALLTIFIAILGLFAFAKYITNGRRKEIAVRKILGANDLQIFKLINTSFFVMVLIANLLSWPLAYILTKKWLGTFAYRIDIPFLPFALSGLITILLTIVTVTIQARKAVKANPVDALKYE